MTTRKTIAELDGIIESNHENIIEQYYSSFQRRYIELFRQKHPEEAHEILCQGRNGGVLSYEAVAGRLSDVRNQIARPLLKDIISSVCGSNRADHSIEGLEKRATDELFDKYVEKIMRHFEDEERDYYRSEFARGRDRFWIL